LPQQQKRGRKRGKGEAERRVAEISTKGCEKAFGRRGRGESTVLLRSHGGCEIIPDSPAKVPPPKLKELLAPLVSPPPPFHSQTRLRE